jgi:dUTP pyrophosphatase
VGDETTGAVLSREQIAALLDGDPPLIEGLIDREAQLQPNGIDLTLASVSRFAGSGVLTSDNSGRRLPDIDMLPFNEHGLVRLLPGPYLVRFNETVNLPADCMAYARPRSSLLRSAVALHTAVWDAGYSGQGVALLVVYNPGGFVLQRDARIVQLVFHRLERATADGYQGKFQGERANTGALSEPN